MYDYTRIYLYFGSEGITVTIVDWSTSLNHLCKRQYKNVSMSTVKRLFSFVNHRAIDLHTQQTNIVWFDWGDSARWYKYKRTK